MRRSQLSQAWIKFNITYYNIKRNWKKALEFGKFMLCCTYFDPTNCHPQHLSRNLVVYKTMQLSNLNRLLHSRKLDSISETENTYISTFFVHFFENINNIILYVQCMYIPHTIFNSKRWWFEENRCKKCTLLQIPCCHLLLLHEDTFSTRAWEFEIYSIYTME